MAEPHLQTNKGGGFRKHASIVRIPLETALTPDPTPPVPSDDVPVSAFQGHPVIVPLQDHALTLTCASNLRIPTSRRAPAWISLSSKALADNLLTRFFPLPSFVAPSPILTSLLLSIAVESSPTSSWHPSLRWPHILLNILRSLLSRSTC